MSMFRGIWIVVILSGKIDSKLVDIAQDKAICGTILPAELIRVRDDSRYVTDVSSINSPKSLLQMIEL
jgi:hypothetical protein